MNGLPEGFVIDEVEQPGALPPGFELDASPKVVSQNRTAPKEKVPLLTQVGAALEPAVASLEDMPRTLVNTPAALLNLIPGLFGKQPFGYFEKGQSVVPEVLPDENAMAGYLQALLPGAEKRFLDMLLGQVVPGLIPPVPKPSPLVQGVAGSTKAVEDLVRGFGDPKVLLSLPAGGAAGPLAKALPAVFAADMISHTPEVYQQAGQASVDGTTAEAFRAGGGALGSSAMIGMIAGHGAKAEPRSGLLREDITGEGRMERAGVVTAPKVPEIPEGFVLDTVAKEGEVPPVKQKPVEQASVPMSDAIDKMRRRLTPAQQVIYEGLTPEQQSALHAQAGNVHRDNFLSIIDSIKNPQVPQAPMPVIPLAPPQIQHAASQQQQQKTTEELIAENDAAAKANHEEHIASAQPLYEASVEALKQPVGSVSVDQPQKLTFKPVTRIEGELIEGEHAGAAVQKRFNELRAAGVTPKVERGLFLGSDGKVYNMLEAARANMETAKEGVAEKQAQPVGEQAAAPSSSVKEAELSIEELNQQAREEGSFETPGPGPSQHKKAVYSPEDLAEYDNLYARGKDPKIPLQERFDVGAKLVKIQNKYKGMGPVRGVPLKPETPEAEGPRLVRDLNRLRLSPDKEGRYQTKDVVNRLRNTMSPGEFKIYEDSGAFEGLPEKVKASELEARLKEKEPKVEVRKFGATEQTPEQREYSKLHHEFWDTLGEGEKGALKSFFDQNKEVTKYDAALFRQGRLSDAWLAQANRYNELARKSIAEDWRNKTKDSSSHWQSIAPKSETEMPGYVEIAVVKRVNPAKPFKGSTPVDTSIAWDETKFPSSHNFPPNTLGFTRGYMETLPNGKKVFHVIEVQSDWAQQGKKHGFKREAILPEQVKVEKVENGWRFTTPDGNTGVVSWAKTAEEAKQFGANFQNKQPNAVAPDPLLSHYNRLALKAAIEHARKEGADSIVISDAETAMMTEGHDRQVGVKASSEKEANSLVKQYDGNSVVYMNGEYYAMGKDIPNAKPLQVEGMRLNYDSILPKIAEELTGSKGERVEMGEHKMTLNEGNYANDDMRLRQARQVSPEAEAEVKRQIQERSPYRKNLIFRNPDGTPKTSVSGLMFPLGKEHKQFSLFGKDKARAEAPTGVSPDDAPMVKRLGLKDGMTAYEAVSKLDRLQGLLEGDQKEVTRFLLQNYGEALKRSTIDLGTGLHDVAHFDRNKGTAYLGTEKGMEASGLDLPNRLLHEATHAATLEALYNPVTEAQRTAVAQLEALRKVSLAALDERAQSRIKSVAHRELTKEEYYHTSVHEFVSGFFDQDFRRILESVKPAEAKSFVRQIWDRILDVLGVKDTNVRKAMERELLRLAPDSARAIDLARTKDQVFEGPGSEMVKIPEALEDEGIYLFFDKEKGKHSLVVSSGVHTEAYHENGTKQPMPIQAVISRLQKEFEGMDVKPGLVHQFKQGKIRFDTIGAKISVEDFSTGNYEVLFTFDKGTKVSQEGITALTEKTRKALSDISEWGDMSNIDTKTGLPKNTNPGIFESPAPRPATAAAGLNFDTLFALPDLQRKDVANEAFSKKFGAERIPILGRALGGKARIETKQDQAVAAWYLERHGIAKAVASSLGAELRGKVNKEFKADAEGNLNVGRTSAEQSLKISDVFEALQQDRTAYRLTDKQENVFLREIQPVLQRMSELTKKYDLVSVVDESGDFRPYFPRVVTELGREGSPTGGNKVGSKQFFQKQRVFTTEAEGWQKGVKYLNDVEARLVKGTERLYTAIADKRLATDPALNARTRGQVVQQLRLAYAEELAAGTMDNRRIKNIANSLQSQGSVWSPAFFGKIFDPKVAKALNKEFAAEQSTLRKHIATANSAVKAVMLGFDFGVGQLQLAPLLFSEPGRWAKANAYAFAAMVHPQAFSTYVKNNLIYVRELSQMGSGVGSLQEYLMGLGKSEPVPRTLEKIPGVGKGLAQVPLAFGRQFQTAIDVAKVELWKAWRDVTPKEQWPEVVQSIESVLLSGRMESAMVPHNRALMERVLLLAPSYYRGAVNFVGALGERGVSGSVARRSMGAFVIGSVAAYYGIGALLGMKQDDLDKRLNPARSDFMMWDVTMDGKKMNMGFGGIFRSFLRLFGNVGKTAVENPGKFASLSPEDNPFTRWLRGHAGPVPSLGWTQFSGRDFLGDKANMGDLPSSIAPLAVQSGGPQQALAGSVGLSSIPKREPSFGEIAEKKFGDRKLSLKERFQVSKERSAQPKEDLASQQRTARRSLEYQQERRQALEAALPDNARNWLKENKLSIGGYQQHTTVKGQTIPVLDDEQDLLFKAMQKFYTESITKLMASPKLEEYKSKGSLQARLDLLLELARKRAMAEWRRSLPRGVSSVPQDMTQSVQE